MIEPKIQREEYNDLCVTCKHFSSCIYLKSGKRPILHCEEFELYDERKVIDTPIRIETESAEEDSVFKGLCRNCGNRKTCIDAKSDRIIWHCEEYV